MIQESRLTEHYSRIANKVNDIIPCEWEKVVIHAEELGDWSFVTFYFYTNDGNVHHWGDISDEYDVNIRTVSRLVDELVQINKDLWLEFKNSEEEEWYSYTFYLDSDWKFSIKYGYEKHEELSGMEIGIRWAFDELAIVPRGKAGKRVLKKYLEEQGKELPEELKEI